MILGCSVWQFLDFGLMMLLRRLCIVRLEAALAAEWVLAHAIVSVVVRVVVFRAITMTVAVNRVLDLWEGMAGLKK